jgi:hypothetical protein
MLGRVRKFGLLPLSLLIVHGHNDVSHRLLGLPPLLPRICVARAVPVALKL